MFFLPQKTISSRTVLFFTRQLATLLQAGLPLLKSLEILTQQESHPLLKKRLEQIIASLHAGNSLSAALASFPTLFSPLYIGMVRAGELGGILGLTIERLSTLQEKREALKKKLTSLFIYPAVVLSITLLVMLFLFIFIAPRFETIFDDLLQGASLPPFTAAILRLSHLIKKESLLCLCTFLPFLLGWRFFLKSPRGALWKDHLLLKIPLLGKLLQKSSITSFAITIGTLTTYGVPLLLALHNIEETTENQVFKKTIRLLIRHIQEGDSLMTPMQASHFFPPMVISMIHVGEETGQLSEMLLRIGTIYEQDVDEALVQIMALLEPLTILLLAFFIGSVVIGLFLPLITVMNSLQMGN